ncbi:HNH endonuclease signature motif containing protein [Aeromonas sp. sif0611]|uniref:HNH endonuclease n=1 Tax=Aeromonas sp. sif0611 TaxID=2854787 RepID=UPI001C4808CF|nr:HNH endonuclease [Aeromonas sp. sif0611]
MSISDKNRKILWGKSGNLCAICRQALVIDPTTADPESVVGDECHIISGAKGGPRHNPEFPTDEIDSLSNLMLLCRVHHKMIDDQEETYTASVLNNIKSNHEKWVAEKLSDKPQYSPVKIRRIKSEIPTQLPVIRSGKEILNLAMACHGTYSDYSDNLNDEEVDLVGGFIQNISDWGDIASELEPIERIRAAKQLDEEIQELSSKGFFVFAATEKQRMEGGINPPSTFLVLHLSIKRCTDPEVVTSETEGQSPHA